jgi:hypothetical protein
LVRVRATCSWPTRSSNLCGLYLRARTRYDTGAIYSGRLRQATGFERSEGWCERCSLPALSIVWLVRIMRCLS